MVGQRATIYFSKYISDHTQNFTGRRWVFEAINDWLADPEAPRFFLITGEQEQQQEPKTQPEQEIDRAIS